MSEYLNLNDETVLPIAYCQEKSAPEGSNLYYAILFENAATKNLIIAVNAFLKEINGVLVECSDPGIARIKYKWWIEEIERLANNVPRHPVTKLLREFSFNTQDEILLLLKCIENHESRLMTEGIQSIEHVENLFTTTEGHLWKALGFKLNISNENAHLLINKLGAYCEFLSVLQIQSTGLVHHHPHTYQSNDIVNLITNLKAKFDDIYRDFPRPERYKAKHLLIICKLSSSLCTEIINSDCKLDKQHISLTPIRKLWIAWRTNFAIKYLS